MAVFPADGPRTLEEKSNLNLTASDGEALVLKIRECGLLFLCYCSHDLLVLVWFRLDSLFYGILNSWVILSESHPSRRKVEGEFNP